MICYYTKLEVNEEFNRHILTDMFIQWLNSKSKNRMEGLKYDGETSFLYSINQKTLRIEDFEDNKKLGIQFMITDPYSKSGFVVEIIYSYDDKVIHLGFYKEINEQSKFIEKISIPRIFKDLLLSSYIKEENGLMIKKNPHYLSLREYKVLKKKPCQLPIVVLMRNKRCCINPVKLSKEILGIGYVLCVYTKSHDLTAKIIYPDGFIENIEIQNEFKMIKDIGEKVRIYMIQENNQYYSFDELLKLKLHKEHNNKKEENKECETYFLKEINKLKRDIEALKQEYKDMKDKHYQLQQTDQLLEKKLALACQDALLISKDKDYEKYQKLVLDVLERVVNDLPMEDNFRKRDVIKSVLRSQK